MMTQFNRMQELKRRFFAMRNGAVADSLRQQGAPYRIIFGLNLPQLVDIAREFGPDAEMALQLRENTASRESLLVAPMLFPRKELTPEVAVEWLRGAMTTEVVDIACLKLLKYTPSPEVVIETLARGGNDRDRYAALRLGANLLPQCMDEVETLAREEAGRGCALTRSLALMLLDDIAWRREEAIGE